jgi:hypothetical protein
MTNNPDLLERPCLNCDGNGFFLEAPDDDDAPYYYEDRTTCGGDGVVLR